MKLQRQQQKLTVFVNARNKEEIGSSIAQQLDKSVFVLSTNSKHSIKSAVQFDLGPALVKHSFGGFASSAGLALTP